MQKSRRKQTVDAWSSLADTVFVPIRKPSIKGWLHCLTAWLMKLEKTSRTRSLSLMEIVGMLI